MKKVDKDDQLIKMANARRADQAREDTRVKVEEHEPPMKSTEQTSKK